MFLIWGFLYIGKGCMFFCEFSLLYNLLYKSLWNYFFNSSAGTNMVIKCLGYSVLWASKKKVYFRILPILWLFLGSGPRYLPYILVPRSLDLIVTVDVHCTTVVAHSGCRVGTKVIRVYTPKIYLPTTYIP